MKQIWRLGCALFVMGLLTACAPKSPVTPSGNPPMVYEGQYVVRADLAAEWCGEEGECQEEVRGKTYLVTPIGDGYSVIRKEALKAQSIARIVPYSKEDDLCYTDFPDQDCDPNWVYTAEEINDPLYRQQWALRDIQAEEAWKVASTSNTPVAVTDTGVDCSHPDINCIGEFNAITGEEGPGRAMDRNGHGTHVASTIGSLCGNAEGICGVGSGIPILACKFLGDSGGGSLSDAIKCLAWAREKGAKVVNASWGCQGCYSRTLLSAIQESRDAGLLVFAAAAGNDGVNNDDYPHYPSNYSLSGFDPIISVASITEDRERSSFSNFGSETVDISAPGTDILAGWPGGGYRSISGTSMATPHVAGASAILISLGHSDPRQSILQSASPINGPWQTGGTLDLLKAVKGGQGEVPTPCRRKKLKNCYSECNDSYKCRYAKQRGCRKDCRKEWCPKKG